MNSDAHSEFDFSQIFAPQVFDTMPARNLNSNFEKLPVWFVNILDKGPRGIFVTKKDDVLQKIKFEF
jgi:hypothetical protein